MYPHAVWLNPQPEEHWGYIPSISLIRKLMGDRMFPLTIDGLDRAIKAPKKPVHTVTAH